MKKDLEIQKNVLEALKWTPLLNANEIGIAVKNGIVTLTGVVDSYPKKIKIARVTQKIAGVRGIADDISVRLTEKDRKTDSEIAQAVLNEIEWHSNLDPQKIKIFVENGKVTLEGTVDWDFQRKSAIKAIGNMKGVREVINNIIITRVAPAADLEKKIKLALDRYSIINTNKINVEVQGHKVILTGKANYWDEILEAEKVVWSAPGVDTIENMIECSEEEYV